MSSGWNWFIVIITLFNIAAVWWLLRHYAKRRKAASKDSSDTTGHVWDGDLCEYNNPLPRWWMVLFFITVIFALIYLALYPGLGRFVGLYKWDQESQYENEVEQMEARYADIYNRFNKLDVAALAQDDEAMKTGHRLYVNNCATCHGSDARGAPGFPNLRDSEWLYGGTPEAIRQSITNGRTGIMTAWGAILGEDGIKSVVAYVQQMSGQSVDSELAAAGQKQFATYCFACHGADGKGNPLFGAPDLTNDIWLYGGSTEAITETVVNGRNGKMPAHKDLLNSDKIHVLTAYIYSLSHQSAGQ
ncbi:MAG: cytochrome-c oxidase, cbb3-type subunit III [Gammaproteobacteria bacterium]|nr:cytochrome-c oxidase, cbb3-type subunit III [Gammaproteobacteria bacterium]